MSNENVNNQNIQLTDAEIAEIIKYLCENVLGVDVFKEKISAERFLNLDFILRPQFINSGKGALIKFKYLPSNMELVFIKDLGWKQGNDSQNIIKLYCRNLQTKLFEKFLVTRKEILMNTASLRYRLRVFFQERLKYNIHAYKNKYNNRYNEEKEMTLLPFRDFCEKNNKMFSESYVGKGVFDLNTPTTFTNELYSEVKDAIQKGLNLPSLKSWFNTNPNEYYFKGTFTKPQIEFISPKHSTAVECGFRIKTKYEYKYVVGTPNNIPNSSKDHIWKNDVLNFDELFTISIFFENFTVKAINGKYKTMPRDFKNLISPVFWGNILEDALFSHHNQYGIGKALVDLFKKYNVVAL
jgi:hypothetical protein